MRRLRVPSPTPSQGSALSKNLPFKYSLNPPNFRPSILCHVESGHLVSGRAGQAPASPPNGCPLQLCKPQAHVRTSMSWRADSAATSPFPTVSPSSSTSVPPPQPHRNRAFRRANRQGSGHGQRLCISFPPWASTPMKFSIPEYQRQTTIPSRSMHRTRSPVARRTIPFTPSPSFSQA